MKLTEKKEKKFFSVKDTLFSLEEISDILSSCKKCGKCQSVCPVFENTGFEHHTARGKISLLQGLEKELLFDKSKIEENLKVCLLCGKCGEACPRNIDTKTLFIKSRLILNDFKQKSFIKKNIIRFFIAFPKIKNFIFGNQKIQNKNFSGKKVLFFSGCLFDQFYRDKTLKAFDIFNKLGYNTSLVSGECCGIPFLSSGDMKKYRFSRERLYGKIIDEKPDFVVSGCPTCIDTIKKVWSEFSYDDLILSEKIKVMDFHEFLYSDLKDLNFSAEKTENMKIKWHTPCHIKSLGIENEARFLVDKFSGCSIEKGKEDSCCGFGGTFSMEHPLMSMSVLDKRMKSLDMKKDELLVTGCPACMMQLGRSSSVKKENILHTIDLVFKNIDKISGNQEEKI
ncbi:MAG: hypothetical protein CSA18_02485 [Deltaproteobacteria bacterium]|nr:MAG: hypothetical protein CSB21_00980 [Deltaproteobacteria bacterium]PIE74995.1 MAG: hypothetical protein CSA18_02485 [Deltaproteobacteria bacterium]